MSNYKILEAQIRQIFASVVWTHKIQEKQADIYRNRYVLLENWKIVLSAIASSGIITTLFIDDYKLKVFSAITSFISLLITSYLKVYDLGALVEIHKKSALELLNIREQIISMLCDIRMNRMTEELIINRRDALLSDLMNIYNITKDASEKAVCMASKNLKARQDNTYSDEEIDSFLPVYLRSSILGEETNESN
jgi:hypothetical protein